MTALALAPVRADLISADDIEERLVEAKRTYARLEGKGGAWAKDGPWYLSRGRRDPVNWRDAIVGALELGEAIETVVQAPRPDRELITRADEAFGWLMRIADDGDRLLVNLAIAELAARGGIRWHLLLKPMGMVRGKGGLQARYRRVLAQLAFDLNG